MSKDIRIIATALPASSVDKAGCLQVALSLSPQLFQRGSRVELGRDYPEVASWPQYAAFFERAIRFRLYAFGPGWQPYGSRLLASTTGPAARGYQAAQNQQLWHQMMPPDTPVSNWQDPPTPFRLAKLLTADSLRASLQQALREAARALRQQPAATTTGREQLAFGRVLHDMIAELDAKALDVPALLAHPLLRELPRRSPPLARLHQRLEAIYADYKLELNRLLLRLELTEVNERNLAESSEFHKRFAAYAQHPELLRRTGWLWHYTLEAREVEAARAELLKKVPASQPNEPRFFLAVDDDVFALDDLQPDLNNSIFSMEDKEDFLQRILNAAPATTGDYWLAWLNKLDVSCAFTAVELLAAGPGEGDLAPTTHSLRWRVGSWQEEADASQARDAALFAGFRDYVLMHNPRFSVKSQLLNRSQLFRQLENVVLRQRGSLKIAPATATDLLQRLSPAVAGASQQRGSQHNGYSASGITLSVSNLPDVLSAVLAQNPSVQRLRAIRQAPAGGEADNTGIAALLVNSALIYQHNVHHGYRVDVVALNRHDELLASSLCSKRETYAAPARPQQPLGHDELEGWLLESVQASTDDTLFYTDEELFHWNDWNLVTPFGNAEEKEEEYRAPGLRIRATAAAQSLVPLRFLWRYSFALRPVDLAGQSAPPVHERLRAGGDWCAGSVHAKFKDFLSSKPASAGSGQPVADIFTRPITHRRVDGVQLPRIFLSTTNPRQQHWGKGTHEQPHTLVVRSCFDGTKLVAEPIDDVRLLAPPRMSLALLMQHGVVDALRQAGSPATLFRQLIDWDYVAAPEASPAETAPRVREDGYVSYLTDPVVDGYELTLDGHLYELPMGLAAMSDKWDQWRKKPYHRLCLTTAQPAAGVASLVLEKTAAQAPDCPQYVQSIFKLRRGFAHEMSLACLLPKPCRPPAASGPAAPATAAARPALQWPRDELFLAGITQVYTSPLSVPLTWAAADLPPAQQPAPHQPPVTFVHAVEKPCLLYQRYTQAAGSPDPQFQLQVLCQSFAAQERAPGAASLEFSLAFSEFPVLTAETYRLHALVAGVVCDRRAPLGYRVEVSKLPVQAGIQPRRSGSGPADPVRERDVCFDQLRHTLPGTRAYRVAYEVEAVSKFSAYFEDRLAHSPDDAHSITGHAFAPLSKLVATVEQALLPASPGAPAAPPAPHYNDAKLRKELLEAPATDLLQVRSTARPPEPVLEKLVPLLHWHPPGPAPTATQLQSGWPVARSCRAVRLYFEGDWYCTGWGEQVAIFFGLDPGTPPAGWSPPVFSSRNTLAFGPPAAGYQELSVSQLISQLGSDPIATVQGIGRTMDDTFFRDAAGKPRPVYEVPLGDLEWDKPQFAGTGPGLEILSQHCLRYVLYEVCFASPEQLNCWAGYTDDTADYYYREGKFYVDVYLDEAALLAEYFPFVRLALARYQPHSIRPLVGGHPSEHYCFSKLVLTDFWQPLPPRSLTITRAAELRISWPAGLNPSHQRPGPPNLLACYISPATPEAARYLAPIEQPGTEAALEAATEFIDANSGLGPPQANAGHFCYHQQIDNKEDTILKLPAGMLPAAAGATLTLAEFEYYENDELSDRPTASEPYYEPSPDPRQDPRYRLIFSYVLPLPTP
ncbi:hypothetical protein [Hymenobacter cheonanensis]|uniref:hypothetical protein n=1 Tax=Hymenobacter sp. CA2-7 TaxID=3063993 RepID=UPI00271441AC|nr:hypothetical protein [Hymenobacter sp. CA2-7]MDO7887348.1 hypothetical protein [Hymenobacter sp. CA2-7]